MDRFPLQVHLEPSDISEVTSRRVLSKNADAQTALGELFDEHRGRLTEHTRLTADIKLPELTRESFIDLYPLLPYQIDLIIQVVSGLRTQGGASKHVGGANRTIIKLAQQLLINPAVNLADAASSATSSRLDQIYDLVEGNIGSEIRAKIAAISKELEHPLAQPVAKVICLLQYVKSVHRTRREHRGRAPPERRRRLAARRGEGGARAARGGPQGSPRRRRLPHPHAGRGRLGAHAQRHQPEARRRRTGSTPRCSRRSGSRSRRTRSSTPRPSRPASPSTAARSSSGDMMFQVHLAEDGKEFDALAAELRTRSQQERKHVFWAVALNDAIDRETVELFRSKEMLARKERETKGEDTPALIAEEQRAPAPPRATSYAGCSARRCLSGRIYFRGNDRSPGDRAVDVGKTAAEVLGQVLPEVFDRFKEAAAKATDVKKGVDALFTAENLQGLPARVRQPRPPARREGQDRLPRRERPAEGSARPHRGARELRRHRERPLPGRRVRQGAVRLGLRGRAPARPLAAARRQDRGDEQGPDARHRHGRRGARHVLEQQPVPAGVVPAPLGRMRLCHDPSRRRAAKDVFGIEAKELQESVIATNIRDALSRRSSASRRS